jgi:cobalt/nickel transport system permease protein
MKTTTKLWIGIGVLAVLSPLGLYLPSKLKAGTAWGEWSAAEIHGLVGYIPKGLQKLSSLWNAPLPGYAFKAGESSGFQHSGLAYIVSAIIGIGLCVGLAFLLGKVLSKKGKNAGRGKTTGGFLERTILGTVSLLKETVSVEQVAANNGFLQRRDSRFKCLSMVLLLITVLVSKSVAGLSVLYCAILILAEVSSIGLLFFLKRTLLFVPMFSFFIVVPAIFNFVTPGEPLFSFNLFAWTLSITRQGVDSAIIFFMRVLDSVSIAVLLVLTTRQHVLLKTLRIFRVPQLFVMTMGMSYRYIFLFLDIIQKMFVAIKSRVGFVSSTKEGRRVVTSNIAGLWLRSYRLQSQVYDAMVSRGYSGEAQVLDEFRAGFADYLITTGALCVLIGTLWLNLYFL